MSIKFRFLFRLVSLLSCKNEKRNDIAHESIDNLKKEADSVWHSKNDAGAIILYSRLIKLDSTNGEYYFHRGVSYSKLLNAYPAVQDFLKAAQLNYKVGPAYRNIAVNYFTIDDSLAVYYINKSLQVEPDDSSVKKLKQKYEAQLKKDKLMQ